MGLNYTDSVARWKREYKLLGAPEDATINDIFISSLNDFDLCMRSVRRILWPVSVIVGLIVVV